MANTYQKSRAKLFRTLIGKFTKHYEGDLHDSRVFRTNFGKKCWISRKGRHPEFSSEPLRNFTKISFKKVKNSHRRLRVNHANKKLNLKKKLLNFRQNLRRNIDKNSSEISFETLLSFHQKRPRNQEVKKFRRSFTINHV